MIKMKKKSLFKASIYAALLGFVAFSCDVMKDVEYKVTPNPLEMHGDSVKVKIEGTFPEKGLGKKITAKFTPKIGDIELAPIEFKGEKAEGNGQTIQYKPGGKFTYTQMVPYHPSMEAADLTVSGAAFKKGKEKETFGPIKLADGTIITPYLLQNDVRVLIGKDKFVRVTQQTSTAQINYEKNKSDVRANELKREDLLAFQNWLAEAVANPKIALKGITISAYSSPEGEEGRNNELSTARAESAKVAFQNMLKKANIQYGQDDAAYQLAGKGEDWAGFKAELEKSEMNEDERNLIIRVLGMYPDPVQREKEIRNMSKTYTFLEKNILPQLRRSQIVINYDLTGFSDEELKNLAKNNPTKLNLEELLFAATLFDDLNDKLFVYREAVKNMPNCWRAINNVGAVLFMQGKLDEAKSNFEQANNIKSTPETLNNLGAIAYMQGDLKKAEQLFNQARSAGSEVDHNLANISVKRGRYTAAIGGYGSNASFNKALAQVLDGKLDAASATLDNSPQKEDAKSYYLRAIIAARKDNENGVVNNLKTAFSKDASLKAKAAKDREFIKFFENPSFTSIVK
jgi:tetratricopeptide (TPR) repeat protein